jgi:TonB family protein
MAWMIHASHLTGGTLLTLRIAMKKGASQLPFGQGFRLAAIAASTLAAVLSLTCGAQESASFAQGGITSRLGTEIPVEQVPVLLGEDNLDLNRCSSGRVPSSAFTGATTLHARIDIEGHPFAIRITHSSGSAQHDEAAVACLSKARFQPGVHRGQPAQGQVDMTVKWKPAVAETCDSSMPQLATLDVKVKPSTDSSPLPPRAEASVCRCGSSEPVIIRSSGYARLDEGAIKLMKSQPAGEDSHCFAWQIDFKVDPLESSQYPPRSKGQNSFRR